MLHLTFRQSQTQQIKKKRRNKKEEKKRCLEKCKSSVRLFCQNIVDFSQQTVTKATPGMLLK